MMVIIPGQMFDGISGYLKVVLFQAGRYRWAARAVSAAVAAAAAAEASGRSTTLSGNSGKKTST